MRYTTCLSTLLLSLSLSLPAFAEDAINYSNTLSGNWGGTRDNLAKKGIATDIIYRFDVMGNVSGGIKEGARALDNLDVIFNFDGEKLAGAKGLSAKIHLLNNFGGHPDADLVGSAQGVDNIEVPRSAARLYQAYIQQNLLDDRLSLLGGLYDVNSEFYVTDSSALFINSTFGMGTDMAQSGQNGPSTFPFTSAGIMARLNPTERTYIQGTILDGVPGEVGDERGTRIDFGKKDGWLVMGETGYTPEGGKIAAGGWYYTSKFDHLTAINASSNPLKKRSQGAYIIGEKQLYADGKDKGLAGFARFGVANGAVNQFNYAWSAGLVYTGAFAGRDEGKLGLGITGAHNGSGYKAAALTAGTPADSAETTLELTYSDKITPWLWVQPDIQYIINPGTDKTLDNALVIASRFTINF
jgi:porin